MFTLDWFTKKCEKAFGKNLICVLLLGSTQRADTTPFSDTDVVVICKTHILKDYYRLRNALRNSEGLLDCSVLYWDEIPDDPNQFHIGSHGCYQLELVLKKAQCIWGQNVLKTLPSPSPDNIRISILHKVIEYTWWARRMFIESNRERSLEDNYKLNSRLIKLVRDFLFLSGNSESITCTVKNALDQLLKRPGRLFTKKERRALLDLGDQSLISENTSNMSDEYFLLRLSIINKIQRHTVRTVHQISKR